MSVQDFSIEKLIEEVKKRKILYASNQECKDYRDKKAREREWIAVCREVISHNGGADWDQLSETEHTDILIEVKKKWTSLRDCFRRELRLIGNTENKKKKYIFFDALKFLEPYSCTTKVGRYNSGKVQVPQVVESPVKQDLVVSDSDSDDCDKVPIAQFVTTKTDIVKLKVKSPMELNLGETSEVKIEFQQEPDNAENLKRKELDRANLETDNKKRKTIENDNKKRNDKRKKTIENDSKKRQTIEIEIERQPNDVDFEAENEERKREGAESSSDADDQAFLKSLLPTFREMNTEQKFCLRIEIMRTILKFKQDNDI